MVVTEEIVKCWMCNDRPITYCLITGTISFIPTSDFFFKLVAFCTEFNLFTSICFVLFMIMDLRYIYYLRDTVTTPYVSDVLSELMSPTPIFGIKTKSLNSSIFVSMNVIRISRMN